MTGVRTIRCNVRASCEARQRVLESLGLSREPVEQLMGGAWRLHTSSAVKLDFPNGVEARKQSQRRVSTGTRVAARAEQRRAGISSKEGRLQQTFRSTRGAGEGEGAVAVVGDR